MKKVLIGLVIAIMTTGNVYAVNVYHQEDKYGEILRKSLENGESSKEAELAVIKAEREDELECLQAIKKGKVLKEITTLYNFDNYRRAEDPLTIYLYEDKFYQINYGTTRIRGGSSISKLRVRCLIDDNFAN